MQLQAPTPRTKTRRRDVRGSVTRVGAALQGTNPTFPVSVSPAGLTQLACQLACVFALGQCVNKSLVPVSWVPVGPQPGVGSLMLVCVCLGCSDTCGHVCVVIVAAGGERAAADTGPVRLVCPFLHQ